MREIERVGATVASPVALDRGRAQGDRSGFVLPMAESGLDIPSAIRDDLHLSETVPLRGDVMGRTYLAFEDKGQARGHALPKPGLEGAPA